MSADFLGWAFAIEADKSPNWITPTMEHVSKYKESVEWEGSNADLLQKLTEAINMVKEGFEDTRNDGSAVTFRRMKCKVLYSGGMSWGDTPTELFEAMDLLFESGLAEEVGFEVGCHYISTDI